MPLPIDTLDLAPGYLAALLALLDRHTPEAQVWAFGSRVGGRAHPGSDLDLVLRHAADATLSVDGCAALREALQNSALPMLVEVHDWSQLPAAFRAEIERRHVVMADRPRERQEAAGQGLGL